MKKHDEGYVLAFVMVVILVLCIVAVSLMTASINNLKAQNAAVQRMVDKYAAQGVIEQVVSVIDSEITISKENGLKAGLEERLGEYITVTLDHVDGNTEDPEAVLTGFSATLQLTSQPADSSARIEATIEWKADVTTEGNKYRITTTTLNYTSYQISTVETGEGVGS